MFEETQTHLKNSDDRRCQCGVVVGAEDDGKREDESHDGCQQEVKDKPRIAPTRILQRLFHKSQPFHIQCYTVLL